MSRNKINLFMDFIAAAEYLKRRGARIVAHSRSNRNLLVSPLTSSPP